MDRNRGTARNSPRHKAPAKKTKRRPGHPKLEITAEQRAQVEVMAGLGLRLPEIATLISISVKTLQRRCAPELERGGAKSDLAVVQNLYRIATGSTPQAVTAAIFWTKVRRRWHEVQRIIHGLDPQAITAFVGQLVSVLRRLVPETCPHCKTHLDLRPKLAAELRALSERLTSTLPPDELVFREGQPEPESSPKRGDPAPG